MSDDDPGLPVPPQGVTTPRADRAAPGARTVALVAAGGALGALARVALTVVLPVTHATYPWATFVANVGGAFALGLVLTLLTERLAADPGVRLLVCTGALGAFTTYSTFANEVATRLLDGAFLLGLGYAVTTLAAGLLAALAGMRAARWWTPRTGPRGPGDAAHGEAGR